FENELVSLAMELSKIDIPQVNKSKKLIEQLQDPDFYKTLHIRKMEEIRVEIRELLQYVESKGIENIYTTITDVSIVSEGTDVEPYGNELYKKNVERFIRDNSNHIVISKLNTNQQITDGEITQLQRILFDGGARGTYDHYHEVYGEQPLGIFIRSIVGLDIQAAQAAFADFLQAGNLNANQMKFIDQIIQHLNRNGTIDKRLLFESPFNELHDQGLLGVFEDTAAMHLIGLIDQINDRANVG
ncbi:MAG: type I restriction enzyme R subunit, partial [Saprospiraceae bacterium]